MGVLFKEKGLYETVKWETGIKQITGMAKRTEIKLSFRLRYQILRPTKDPPFAISKNTKAYNFSTISPLILCMQFSKIFWKAILKKTYGPPASQIVLV